MYSAHSPGTIGLVPNLNQGSISFRGEPSFSVNPPEEHQAANWLKSLLEDVGFGVLILDSDLNIRFCNNSARAALASSGFEFLSRLTPASTQKVERLVDTSNCPSVAKFLSSARLVLQGERKLILLGDGENQIAVALSPISIGEEFSQDGVLVTTERETLCETISLWAYGRAQGLTEGELRVLELLTSCHEPIEVADSLKISLSTVRSHIRSMISKTESSNLRDLLLRVSKLPPSRALRCEIKSGTKHEHPKQNGISRIMRGSAT